MFEYYNAELKEWQGPTKPCLFNPKATVGDILFYGLSQSPNKVAQICVDDDSHMTRSEMKVKSIRFALYLQKELGLKRGDVVSFITLNHKLVAPALYGCIFNGIPYNCAVPKSSESFLTYVYNLLKPKLVVCEDYLEENIEKIVKSLNLDTKVITFKTLEDKIMNVEVDGETTYQPSFVSNDTEKEVLLYSNTSGTTGVPKIMPMSHAFAITRIIGFRFPPEGDLAFVYTPMAWISATMRVLLNPLGGGVRLITNTEFSEENQAKIVQKYRLTSFTIPSSFLSTSLDYLKDIPKIHLSSVKHFSFGGTIVYQDVISEYERLLPEDCKITNGYGSTEASVFASTFNGKREGSTGLLHANTKIKVIGELGQRLGPNESGDIWVKLNVPILPYINQVSNDYIDEEGWFSMGDIGYLDSEGFIFIQGRSKDVIKYLDQNGKLCDTFASIIENFIRSKTDFTEICVTAVPNPKLSYESPAALIQRKKGSKFTEKDIQDLVKKELYPIHLDGGVYFVDELPRTAVGKIQILEVQKIILEMKKNKI